MSWASLSSGRYSGINFESLQAGTLLTADILNAFSEAIDERWYMIDSAGVNNITFQKGEFLGKKLFPIDADRFFDKLNNLIESYKGYFTNYTWVKSDMMSDPTLTEASYTIGTSELQTILNHPTSSAYDTIINKTPATRTWRMVTRAEVFTGLYLMLKNLRYIKRTVSTIASGGTKTLGTPYAIIDSGKASGAEPTDEDQSFSDFIDYSALESTFSSNYATNKAEGTFSADNRDILTQRFDFIRTTYQSYASGGSPEWSVTDDYGSISANWVYPRNIELLCKRLSDDAVLSMTFKTVFSVTTNNSSSTNLATWESDLPDSGTSVNDSTSATYDANFPTSGLYEVAATVSHSASGSKQVYRDSAIPYVSPDTLGISLYPRANFEADGGFGGGINGNTVQDIGKINELTLTRASYCYVDLNNSSLDYYIS